jgi:uncharacterized protein
LVLGTRMQNKVDQAVFRNITLWVLLVASLNIMRKAVMG